MRDRRRLLRALPAIWLVALLALPVTLWLLGARQPLVEQRPKEEFPAFNRSSLRDPATFARIDRALLDRLPLRERSLDLHARIAIDVFKDSSNPLVAIGHDGWLYFQLEIAACQAGNLPVSDPADTVDVLARTLVASGRDATVVMVPSKLFVHPEDAPDMDAEAERCQERIERAMTTRLATTPGGLSLDADLAASERAGRPVFLKKDSHWNWRGRAIYVRHVLERMRPGLADDIGLEVGYSFRRAGDLLRLMGRDDDEAEGDRAVFGVRTAPSPFQAGDVVIIGDSQTEWSLIVPTSPDGRSIVDLAAPGSFFCTWDRLERRECDDAIRRARVVVVEKVARDATLVAAQCWIPVALAAESLRGAPAGRWEPVDGSAPPRDPLELGASGAATVRVRLREDVADVPRLLRLPVQRLAPGAAGVQPVVTMEQQPQAGPPAPCATMTQGAEGGALLLPVPAGRRASDLIVRLSGTAGTRIGRPELIALDGR